MEAIATELNGHDLPAGFRRVPLAKAACTGSSGDLFFSPMEEDAHAAKDVCMRCPVRWECLAYALGTDQKHGVWGGLTAEERRLLRHKISQDMTV